MKLLAIPNDATRQYQRSSEFDFLSEFNPIYEGKRFFESVHFLNWKDEIDEEYCGIRSHSFLKDKSQAKELTQKLSGGEIKFDSPLYEPIFNKEIEILDTIVEEYRPDIIRTFNSFFASELGCIISSRHNIPLVVSVHDPSRLTPSISSADSLVCISDYLKELCVTKYRINPSNIDVIPDGIDLNTFKRIKPESNPLVDEYSAEYKVLSVGRIVPSKNIETLLHSVKKIKNLKRNLIHIHLGNGTEEKIDEITKIRDDLGLNGTTHFLGGIKKNLLPFYYSWADVYALPTLWEGLGRAQIESLSCGTPVITSNYPPMNSVVTRGYNGLTADPRNSEEFADKILLLLENNAVIEEMRLNCRASVEKYDIRDVMKKTSEAYKRLI